MEDPYENDSTNSMNHRKNTIWGQSAVFGKDQVECIYHLMIHGINVHLIYHGVVFLSRSD